MKSIINKFSIECDNNCDSNNTNGNYGGSNGVTVNSGDGEKDLIVVTGPLSNVFTKALGVYFAKTPINDDNDGGEIAVETQAIDSTVQQLINEASNNHELFAGADTKLTMASQFDNFNVNPDTNVIVVPSINAGLPETIEEVTVARTIDEKAQRDTVLVVQEFDGTTLEEKTTVVDVVNDNKDAIVADIDDGYTNPSVESLYSNIKGLTVVKNVKGFGEWVSNKLKK